MGGGGARNQRGLLLKQKQKKKKTLKYVAWQLIYCLSSKRALICSAVTPVGPRSSGTETAEAARSVFPSRIPAGFSGRAGDREPGSRTGTYLLRGAAYAARGRARERSYAPRARPRETKATRGQQRAQTCARSAGPAPTGGPREQLRRRLVEWEVRNARTRS